MNKYRYVASRDEKPLDYFPANGGYTSIFRTIACVGDSLSSGEFEIYYPKNNTRSYHDMFEYSWGQFIARMAGLTAYNFSRGGMTASEYCDSYAEARGWWDPALKAQAYVIALGVNDLINAGQPLGEMSDIHPTDPAQNAKTFTGYYARVIRQYKAIAPDAKFFLVTMPHQVMYESRPGMSEVADAHAARLHELAAYFENTYVIDLRQYAPDHDEAFTHMFYLNGHMNPMGYRLTAKMVESYIDYIVRHNPEEFYQVGFIGKPQYDERLDKKGE